MDHESGWTLHHRAVDFLLFQRRYLFYRLTSYNAGLFRLPSQCYSTSSSLNFALYHPIWRPSFSIRLTFSRVFFCIQHNLYTQFIASVVTDAPTIHITKSVTSGG